LARLLERPEHQGKRRAELVADIGKERGLGAVDLGQRFGSPLLLFIGLGIGDCGGDLAGGEIEEARVVVVIEPDRAQANDQHAGPTGLAVRHDRQQDGAGRGQRPGAGRRRAGENARKVENRFRLVVADPLADRPARRIGELQGRR